MKQMDRLLEVVEGLKETMDAIVAKKFEMVEIQRTLSFAKVKYMTEASSQKDVKTGKLLWTNQGLRDAYAKENLLNNPDTEKKKKMEHELAVLEAELNAADYEFRALVTILNYKTTTQPSLK